MSAEDKISVSRLIDDGRIAALWGLAISSICVLGILFSNILHIQPLADQLSTIAELSIPSSMLLSGATTAIHHVWSKDNNGNAAVH